MIEAPTTMIQERRARSTSVSCPTAMTAALPPEQVVAYVRELSADVTHVVVLARNGAVLAGAAELAREAIAVRDAMEGPHAAARTERGVVLAVRSEDAVTVVVVAGAKSLIGPSLLDASAAIGAEAPDSAAQSQVVNNRSTRLQRAAETLILASTGDK